jgi:outer membrane protein assembly factor BamB
MPTGSPLARLAAPLALVVLGVFGGPLPQAARLVRAQAQAPHLPSTPLVFGVFTATFAADGTFVLTGQGWPRLAGSWRASGGEITFVMSGGPAGCETPGRYRFSTDGRRVSFGLVDDGCQPRRMILDRSEWLPPGGRPAPPPRRIVVTPATGLRPLPPAPGAAALADHWPSFRGREAAGWADGQGLPERWSGETGASVRWRVPVPGLAHSSPIVWGDLVFVTSAISSAGEATFKPGLYGDGDASEDRSPHRWMLYAFDRRTGARRWASVAAEGPPLDKRHIKSTYASATPATDGRIVVAAFGSRGVHAFDLSGAKRWSADLGRMNMGAYDIPTFEWGPASSPVIWNDLVIVQVDTQDDSFLAALDAATGRVVWKTERDELPSWGTPTVAATEAGPLVVTNAARFVRAYDARTGQERWRVGRSSKITAPTPIFAEGLFVVASGRAPERPIFVVRPGARGDVTLGAGETANAGVAWSKTGRGSYMPTPLAYQGILYVLANNGVFDAYDLRTGDEIYRQRLPVVGSGYSASPVAADGRIYLAGEDGDILVVRAGRAFEHLGTHAMGELLMATPALSAGTMFVRGAKSLFAIGK